MAFNLAGSSSSEVNGQLVPRVRVQNYFPRPLSAVGPGGSGVPAFPPQTTSGFSSVASPAGTNSASAASVKAAGSNPWSPVHSPVPWLIGFFIVGVLLLRFVHHGY